MRYGPWPRRGRLLRHLSFSSSFPRGPNPGGAGHVKGALAHRAQRGLPWTWPRQDYIARLEEEEKRRSNRQPPAAARGRPLPWCPAATAGGQGKEHATRHWCPAAHSPASKRPFVQPRSAATDEGCGGTLPPRCPPAHARAASGTRVRRHHRGLEGLTLTQEPYGSTLQSLPRREERPQRDRGRSEE